MVSQHLRGGLEMAQRTQVVGYIRASLIDQNHARQLEAIGDVDRVFAKKPSGGSREDPAALEECVRYVRLVAAGS